MKRSSSVATKYWTFAQALGWVIYRRNDVVSYVGPFGSGKLSLVAMYPSHFEPALENAGDGEELLNALREGRLTAKGKLANGDGVRREIPAEDWALLKRYGDAIYEAQNDRSSTSQPWRDITLESATVMKLWRSSTEVSGRSKYDWTRIKALFQDVCASNPDFSRNELIVETQGRYRDKFNKEPPSRSSFQRRMRNWI